MANRLATRSANREGSRKCRKRASSESRRRGVRDPHICSPLYRGPSAHRPAHHGRRSRQSISSPRQSQTSNQPIHASCPSRCARRASAYRKQHLIHPLHIPAKENCPGSHANIRASPPSPHSPPLLHLTSRRYCQHPSKTTHQIPPKPSHAHAHAHAQTQKHRLVFPPQFPNPKTKRPRSTS